MVSFVYYISINMLACNKEKKIVYLQTVPVKWSVIFLLWYNCAVTALRECEWADKCIYVS